MVVKVFGKKNYTPANFFKPVYIGPILQSSLRCTAFLSWKLLLLPPLLLFLV